MKKRLWNILTILLLLICILESVQIIADVRLYNKSTTHFVTELCQAANAVSINLTDALGASDDRFNAGIGSTRIYLEQLANHFLITDYSLRYNVLWIQHGFLDGLQSNGYIATTFIQDKFEKIYQKHINGYDLDEFDFTYLAELVTALDTLCKSLQNEDGSLNQKATQSAYFVEQFNKFTTAVYIVTNLSNM